MDMTLLKEVLNEPLTNIQNFPPMMVVMIGLALFGAVVLVGFETGRADKHMRDTPGWFDLPAALFLSWGAAAVYGVHHQEVSYVVAFTTVGVAVLAFFCTVPFLLLRSYLRDHRVSFRSNA